MNMNKTPINKFAISDNDNVMVRRCGDQDFDSIWAVINDGAEAYRGIIPADCLADPYLSREELHHEIAHGVEFWGYEEGGMLLAVMGIQSVEDVTLVRHAYVRTGNQKHGIGAQLLSHLRQLAKGPVLLGTWKDAVWAIRFYEKNGFSQVGSQDKDRLLRRYWTVPLRQIEMSVVLADQYWHDNQQSP